MAEWKGGILNLSRKRDLNLLTFGEDLNIELVFEYF